MQTNERGDVVVSPDENIKQLIKEYMQTMEEGWLQKTLFLFREIENIKLMQPIISEFENINKSWKSPEIAGFITQLHGIYWQKHQAKGKKFLEKLVFPAEHYASIYKDQLENNEKARIKFQSV